ncbi:EAL domain-containing protein [Cetobacterium sp. ZWU0022]|uniref:EAL domain-containing protein n=1 Tax=Cetobacterium sp. ZWU0022 TaxID=1340502 RepID=UPI000645F8AF|nr:EAL domain-containing protein [Cetobacterium sp. ZWU0022]
MKHIARTVLNFIIKKFKCIEEKRHKYQIKSLLKKDLKELFCLYQPKLNLLDNSLSEFEALARIEYKNKIISPLFFIPLAEKFDLIHKIDYKIMELNMKLISELLNKNKDLEIKISFNVSIKTLERSDFIFEVTKLLKKYNLKGKYFEVEITETILIKNLDLFLEKIIKLKELELDVSLDDFTAGFSNFNLLALAPISKVKIDKSLLDNYNIKKGEIIYINLIKLINSLELCIVAEGVETESQLEFLKKQNINHAQGYLIGKPDLIEKFIL